MAFNSIREIKRASLRARTWLESVKPTIESGRLQQLGLTLCERICNRQNRIVLESASFKLPSLSHFVLMSRDEVRILSRDISVSDPTNWRARKGARVLWAKVFGSAALSFAREGDLPTVASLVRAAAHLGLTSEWLADSIKYLLDQQHPDGYFGLFAPELTLLNDDGDDGGPQLRMTVEVLWALSEAAAP